MRPLILAVLLVSPLSLEGLQTAPRGSLGGQVVSRVTHAPIRTATVELTLPAGAADSASRLSATADSSGHFLFAELAPAAYVLEIRAAGYEEGAWRLRVTAGRQIEHMFDLVPDTVQLPPVVVEGQRPAGRLVDFERRRAGKMGFFVTREEIDKLNASTLSDVLGTVRGVTLDCAGGACNARMARAQPGCEPQYFIDGFESSAYFARLTPPHDVIGLEIYRGPSELPAEFSGSNSGCGVIVIWTKSSP